MHATPLDTHKAVNQLKASGIEEKQAEALVGLMSNLLTDKLATKQDLEAMQIKTQSEFIEVKKDIHAIKSDIRDMKSDFNDMKSDFNDMKSDLNDVKSEVKNLKTDMDWIKRILLAIGITVFVAAFKYIFIA